MANRFAELMDEEMSKQADAVTDSIPALVQAAQQQGMMPSNIQNIIELYGQVAEKELTQRMNQVPDPSAMGPSPIDLEVQRAQKMSDLLKHQRDMKGYHRDLESMDLEDQSMAHALEAASGGAPEDMGASLTPGAGVQPGGGGVPTGVPGLPPHPAVMQALTEHASALQGQQGGMPPGGPPGGMPSQQIPATARLHA
jgi:hypothetical protein